MQHDITYILTLTDNFFTFLQIVLVKSDLRRQKLIESKIEGIIH